MNTTNEQKESNTTATAPAKTICKVGLDAHGRSITVARQLDGANPQRPQGFPVPKFLTWVEEQVKKAEGRKQKAESRRQKAESRRQRAEGDHFPGGLLPSAFCVLPSAFCILSGSPFNPVSFRMMMSTRRFFARPSSVSLSSNGLVSA